MVKLIETLDQESFENLLKSTPATSTYESGQHDFQEAYRSDHSCDSCLTCDGCNRAPIYSD